MTTDITKLAQRMKAAAVRAKAATEDYVAHRMSITVCLEECKEFNDLSDGPDNILALVEALEKTRQHAKERDAENQDLMLTVGRLRVEREGLEVIRAAAEKLVRCKGRYHSEQNYRALAALFGVMTPDLPPLDSESRTVTVKLPDYRHERFWDSRCEEFNPAAYQAACVEMWREEITAAGIKWETE